MLVLGIETVTQLDRRQSLQYYLVMVPITRRKEAKSNSSADFDVACQNTASIIQCNLIQFSRLFWQDLFLQLDCTVETVTVLHWVVIM